MRFGIDIDSAGNVWVSGDAGAAKRDVETGQWQRYRLTNTGLPEYFVHDLSIAPDGTVWATTNFSTGTGGISQFDGLRWHNHNVSNYGLGEDWPFPCDNAQTILFRTATGRTIFNPDSGGLHEWDGSNYSMIEPSADTRGLVEDDLGRLWFLEALSGRLRYYDGAFHTVTVSGVGDNLKVDPYREGTVWASTSEEVVRTDGSYRASFTKADFPELDWDQGITGVAPGPGEIAWVGGSYGGGLFRVDMTDRTYQWFHPSNSDLPGDFIRPLVVSPDGVFWFTTHQSSGTEWGLGWYDGEQFGMTTRAEGLPHSQIWDTELRMIPGGYEIWFSCVSEGIGVLTVSMDDPASAEPTEAGAVVGMDRNFPNPFADRTEISYSLQHAGTIELTVHDVQGRVVRTLVSGSEDAGSHAVSWDGRNERGRLVENGVYFYRLATVEEVTRRQMILVR